MNRLSSLDVTNNLDLGNVRNRLSIAVQYFNAPGSSGNPVDIARCVEPFQVRVNAQRTLTVHNKEAHVVLARPEKYSELIECNANSYPTLQMKRPYETNIWRS